MKHTTMLGASICTILLLVIVMVGAGMVTADDDTNVPPPELGRWECWDDGSFDPCHRNLVEIQALAEHDLWIAAGGFNSAGIFRYEGSEWQELPLPPRGVYDEDILALTMLSEDDGWAVGNDLAWHWDGEAWYPYGANAGWDFLGLNGVDAAAADDVWAVGRGRWDGDNLGAVAHWNGYSWSSNPVPDQLLDLTLVSSAEGWAVGYEGVIYLWNGSAWIRVGSPVSEDLWAIESAPSGVWVVGENGTILHNDGGGWNQINSPTNHTLLDITMTASGDGWIVGEGGATLRFDGSGWQQVPGPPGARLTSVAILSADSAYAVGQNGEVVHWNGTTWEVLYGAPERRWLYDVVAVNPTDAWVAGQGGRLEHWNGKTWQPVSSPVGQTLADLAFLTKNNGWAVGEDGIILHWDGSTWQPAQSPTDEWLNAVDFAGRDNGWAVGENGIIVRFDGESWSEFPSPTEANLRDVQMASPNSGWAVGGGFSGDWNIGYIDVILHWDGSSWEYAVPEDSLGGFFSGVDVLAQDSVYAANIFGLYHWDGDEWEEADDPGVGQPRKIDFFNPVNGWVTAWNGVIGRWDGHEWTMVFNDIHNVAAVDAYTPYKAWAVTGEWSGGAILEFCATPPDHEAFE